MLEKLSPFNYYRLPWSLTDNVLAWLEPTKRCNLICEGCYSRNTPNSDKSLEQIRGDLQVITANRHVDSISIAGGEPLIHPQIIDIVRMVRNEFHLKPIVNTNGQALTPELLSQLKKAGCYGFTFHIDSSQKRAGWMDASEEDLNSLRLRYASMVAAEGNMSVSFNMTVFPHTLEKVPLVVDWAQRHIDIVNTIVFILFRTARESQFRYFANGQPVDVDDLVYLGQKENPVPLKASDVIAQIQKADPLYEPSGYLGGTYDPQSFKWLIATRLGTKERVFGYLGHKSMELMQVGHHLFKGSYFGYLSPSALKLGRSAMFGFSAVDSNSRQALFRYLSAVGKSPQLLGQSVRTQSIAIIQPIDMMPDGRTNMCDGCPDMTVHKGELVWSCRLDERTKYGVQLEAVPLSACRAPGGGNGT